MPKILSVYIISAVMILASALHSDASQKREAEDARNHSTPTTGTSKSQKEDRYNILFLVSDDMNDWIGSLDGHRDAITPNLDRLAERSIIMSTTAPTSARRAAPRPRTPSLQQAPGRTARGPKTRTTTRSRGVKEARE